MYRKKVIGLVIALAVVAISVTLAASGAFAQGPYERPFNATFEGSALPDGSGMFDMQATHLGHSSGVGKFIVVPSESEPGCFDFIEGAFTWTAANGDAVYTTVSDADFSACVVGGDGTSVVVELTATEEITGGTGRFEGATGEVMIEIVQTVDLSDFTSTFTGTKTGVIVY